MTSATEILAKIQQQIEETTIADELTNKGEVLEVKDGVAIVSGLQKVMFSEIVIFENWSKGLVLDLLPDQVGILVLGEYKNIKQWDTVNKTDQVFSVGVGTEYLGRVVNGIGEIIDGWVVIKAKEHYPVERVASGVMTRKSVHQPLQTGIKAIDSMVPIGRWQRELIIGDRQTGKTSVAIDTIINQKEEWVKCIYVAIGQKESKIKRIVETLKENGALDHTIIVNASANAPAVMQYLAPYVWCALGEYFMLNGEDALIVYDDLSKHAVAYREISLLLKRPPGREAYPGDVFYQHSKLLERAAKLNEDYGSGSLTALPIIETQAGDVSAYISTNVISITDGQIFLETDLFNAGVRPAINVGTSVSRVGGSAQTGLMKKISWWLRLDLATYRELAAFAQFASDLDPATQKKLSRWQRLVEVLKQKANKPLKFYQQAAIIYAATKGYLDELELTQIWPFESLLLEKLENKYMTVVDTIKAEKKLTDIVEQTFTELSKETLEEIKAATR